MDVNNTRFHLLLSERDWRPHLPKRASADDGSNLALHAQTQPPDVEWDGTRHRVSLRRLMYRFPTLGQAQPLDIGDRRGAGCDRYGNWYSINSDGTGILYLPAGREQAQTFWPAEISDGTPGTQPQGGFEPLAEPQPAQEHILRGLAVTTHHYLVVGVLEPFSGLLIFDLHAGGAPVRVQWPESVTFHPLDITPRADGGVWILDRQIEDAHDSESRYWALDRYFRVEARDQNAVPLSESQLDDFQPVEGDERRTAGREFPAGLSLAVESPPLAKAATAIEVLPDDTVLILEVDPQRGSRISRYSYQAQIGRDVAIDEILKAEWAASESSDDAHRTFAAQARSAEWKAHDLAFVPDNVSNANQIAGKLYVVGDDGTQAYAFQLEVDDENQMVLTPLYDYLPLRRFGGKALVAADQEVYYDFGDRWLPVTAKPKPRYRESGVIETSLKYPFDGKTPDCVWHRLFVDAWIPPGTAIRVESRAAKSESQLATEPWQAEPGPYLRSASAEVPYYRPFPANGQPQPDGTGTWELLFQQATGRYLQLRLTLNGNRQTTPSICALRVHYPRFSYLKHYLPDVYQHDETSAAFLDRFLANVEGTFTELEGTIAEVQNLFDERTVDAEYLDWLTSWFGVMADPAYDARKRRLFIKHAVELFNQRGTLAGLVRAVRFAIDPAPDESLFDDATVAAAIGNSDESTACESDRRNNPFGVRVIERFLTRNRPGIEFGDPTELPALRLSRPDEPWSPRQGAQPIHERFRRFIQRRYQSAATQGAQKQAWGIADANDAAPLQSFRLSPVLPADEAQRADWRVFIRGKLGFTYEEVTGSDKRLYQDFLVRRYRLIDRLNAEYQARYQNFGEIDLPAENDFPEKDARLFDWIQFVSLALPIQRNSHQFSVLVPTLPDADLTEQSRQLDLVRRVVELEKPAHTNFEVKPYWALFQVGTARLGLDTLLDQGSRYTALLLGKSYLPAGYVGSTHPWNVADRTVTGRDQAGTEMTL